MNDAVALLAISQLVCLAGIAYLYAQVQALRKGAGRVRRSAARMQGLETSIQVAARGASQQAARKAYGTATPPHSPARAQVDRAALAARINELGMDVPALARHMRRSEEEVRLLLRRQGLAR